jgi:hypothetical protein
MGTATQLQPKFYGLLELDPAGTVLYSRIEGGGDNGQPAADATGRNFYTEVAPFENVAEFQHCLDSFSRGSQQADSIQFICNYDDGPLPVKVLLARIREHSGHEAMKSILVHIRKI